MSTITWHPWQLTGLNPTDGDGKISFDTDGSVLIDRVWTCPYSMAFSLCPRPRDPAGNLPQISNTRCISSSLERQKPNNAIVRATYQGTYRLPFTIYSMEASRDQKPITYHPKFNDPAIFGDAVGSTSGNAHTKVMRYVTDPTTKVSTPVFDKFLDIGTSATDPNIKFAGIEGYLVASAVFRKTSYAEAADFMLNNIFTIQMPETGGSTVPGSPSNWLKADKTCRNMYRGASQIWEIQETWLFNPNGWLKQIYNPPSYS